MSYGFCRPDHPIYYQDCKCRLRSKLVLFWTFVIFTKKKKGGVVVLCLFGNMTATEKGGGGVCLLEDGCPLEKIRYVKIVTTKSIDYISQKK